MTLDDVETGKAMRLAALRDAPEAFGSSYEQASRRTDEEWRGWISNLAVFGAFLGGEPVGMVAASHDADAAVTDLISMWVSPVARGRRLAGLLTDEVLAYAREQGARAVHLEVVEGNDGATAAYLRSGFVFVPPYREGQDHRSMWLALEAA